MKATRYLFTFLVLAMLALTACHNDDLPGGNTLPEGAVHITADIEGVQTRAPQLDADGAGSFEPADEWGMYTFTGDATSPAYSNQNIAYRAGNSNPLYWKDLSETDAPARHQPSSGRWHDRHELVFRPNKLRGKEWRANDVCQRGGEPADRRGELRPGRWQCNPQ